MENIRKWNKNLLRTKRPPVTRSFGIAKQKSVILVVCLAALLVPGAPAEARYQKAFDSDQSGRVINNERDSVAAMIQFRNELERAVYGPVDASLTLILAHHPSSGGNNNQQRLADALEGVRFHAVAHSALCDGDLSAATQVDVKFVWQALQEVDNVNMGAQEEAGKHPLPGNKYLCAMWSVSGVKNVDQLMSVEWLSANGIERRRSAGVDDGEEEDMANSNWGATGAAAETVQYLMHLGGKSRLEANLKSSIENQQSGRTKRDLPVEVAANANPLSGPTPHVEGAGVPLRIKGFRVEQSDKEAKHEDDNVPQLQLGTNALLRLFGTGITDQTTIIFTEEKNEYGGPCQVTVTESFHVIKETVTGESALVEVRLPKAHGYLYFCARQAENRTIGLSAAELTPFVHQGVADWLRLSSYELPLPLWISVMIIVVCLMFSALFSGLNLGLMSLDRTELKILKNTGSEQERAYAAKIQPVRDHGNYLLCSILLGNVLVNSTFTILLDGLTSGLVAVICSTVAIVIFGEITPQAICSRHGLAVGAKTIFVTKIVMVITAPLAYPVSLLLDRILGEEIGNVYNRERLKELVRVTKDLNDLDKDEVNIISGALELRKKTVGDVMTHIEDAFMLDIDAVLDFETVSDIMKSGFSRIPVFEKIRQNIVTLLYIKDLAFVDPDDNTPLKTLCEFYENPCHFVFDDVTLDVMFKQFKDGHKGHMAFVHRVNNEGDGDPFYETIGLITLEDVIEELIQAEIMDETDVFTDNRTKVRRQRVNKQDFTMFAERRENHRIRISPQLTLATFQYLSTSVDAFKRDSVSETILRRLLNQDIIHHVRCKGKEKDDVSMVIYQQGKPVDYFVLILEGRVEVTVGRENLVFESGPFTYFGIQALVQNVGVVDSPQQPSSLGGGSTMGGQVMGSLQSLNMDALLRTTFVPDYSVRAVTETMYIAVKRTLYLAAKRATLMERSQRVGDQSNEAIDDEVEKLLHSLDEDERSIGADTANLMMHTPKMQSRAASKAASMATSPANQMMELANGQLTGNSVPYGARSASIPNQNSSDYNNSSNDGGVLKGAVSEETELPLLPRSKS